MQEVDQPVPKDLIITAYWPQQRGEQAIGYGMSREYLLVQILGTAIPLGREIFWFFAPRVRPAKGLLWFFAPRKNQDQPKKPGLHISPLMVLSLALAIFQIILSIRGSQSLGYYQLDGQGKPLRFLAKKPPESIQGQKGTDLAGFLERESSHA
ncbi:hypothetical protein EPA93_01970 [Ktedonosporobacter rubrisoli]|uniref:Uncharacterized protein n=1 Tax=Ktedonosporobacter rubrisoli TaxID=2509675 RepID=A0A4P6JID8_KTERU|nr:hypothetical protein [Ktedonosporobacter rubrisoli]QBD74825.1 hypothetical protein EPA93_01970 [Ktedonosporobacter rubrisoli]